MKSKQNQNERVITATLYLFVILLIYYTLKGDFNIFNQNKDISIWFYSGVLLIIMGKYITEPYFPTPSDSLSNSISTLIILVSLDSDKLIYGSKFLIIFSLFLIILSILNIILKNRNEKFWNISYFVLKNIGSSNFIFSLIYLSSSFSYFGTLKYINTEGPTMFIISIALWICIIFFDIVGILVNRIFTFFSLLKNQKRNIILGKVIKNMNNNYFIEVDKSIENIILFSNKEAKLVIIKNTESTYLINLVINSVNQVETILLETISLKKDDSLITFSKEKLSLVGLDISLNDEIGTSRLIDISLMDESLRMIVENSYYFINSRNFIGLIQESSNINIIRFSIYSNEKSIKEGSIIKTKINNDEILYQIINGITDKEILTSKSEFGYISGYARKLGKYNINDSQLESINWIPNIYEPVYTNQKVSETDYKTAMETTIGRLPNTDMVIPLKNIDSLVTHNTAILGILGVGKSYLTFELIKKIVNNGTKIICIDITNQYGSENGLLKYIDSSLIHNDICKKRLDDIAINANATGNRQIPNEWGNLEYYRTQIEEYIKWFLDDNQIKKILIFNPDNHIVKKAASSFNIESSIDVSIVEKSKIISEVLLKESMGLGQTDKARCCLVLEEGHSLAPEWNSIVVAGDEKHSNGLSKVILQGRKYGLGCILITQRTANVTKSILNQCNTIFALRIYDDTGKSFLENYIGKDYSETLPALEERHAIVIGKGIGLKQPVIIELNDAKYIQIA